MEGVIKNGFRITYISTIIESNQISKMYQMQTNALIELKCDGSNPVRDMCIWGKVQGNSLPLIVSHWQPVNYLSRDK